MALDDEKLKKLWPDAKSTEIAKCRQALAILGFQLPMFAIAASTLRIRVTDKIDSIMINRHGVCFINEEFVRGLSLQELGFCIAHDILHLLSGSAERQQHREQSRWDRACDRAINQVLQEIIQSGSTVALTMPKQYKVLMPTEDAHKNWESERLYEVEPETPQMLLKGGGGGGSSSSQGKKPSPNSGGGGGEGDKNQQQRPKPGAGCGVDREMPNDAGFGEDLDPSQAQKSPELMWRSLAEQCKSIAAGTQAGQALARIIEPPKARISWARLLRHTISQILAWPGRDDQSFNRRNRRYCGSKFLMPGYVTARKNLAIIVDTSGSMSDRAVARCVAEVANAAKHPDIRIYMVVHDAQVQWQGWLQPNCGLPSVWSKMKGRGGTIFDPAYAAIAELKEKFDVMIHLTDGGCFGEWPAKPANVSTAIAALVGHGEVENAPDNYKKILVEPGI